jgi:hypothetical protein
MTSTAATIFLASMRRMLHSWNPGAKIDAITAASPPYS